MSLLLKNDLEALPQGRFSFPSKNPLWVLGLDEVGRGCCAGPVVAACAAFRWNPALELSKDVVVQDSKKLSARKRKTAVNWIHKNSLYAVAESSVAEIDEINILQASLLAMERAFQAVLLQIPELERSSLWVRIDGNQTPKLLKNPKNFLVETVVQGDSKSFAIAAASILAKEYRDSLMTDLSLDFPEYKWESNVGYPTPVHKEAMRQRGLSEHHRKSFDVKL